LFFNLNVAPLARTGLYDNFGYIRRIDKYSKNKIYFINSDLVVKK